jgi:hypothetical protein
LRSCRSGRADDIALARHHISVSMSDVSVAACIASRAGDAQRNMVVW